MQEVFFTKLKSVNSKGAGLKRESKTCAKRGQLGQLGVIRKYLRPNPGKPKGTNSDPDLISSSLESNLTRGKEVSSPEEKIPL